MAQAGVGVDMLEISRMERVMRRHPRFLQKVFSPEEIQFCEHTDRPARHFAERMAARGAVLRALGATPADGACILDVTVSSVPGERPRANLSGKAQQLAHQRGVQEIALSLSFTGDVAVANAVAMTRESRPRQERKPDLKAELRATFRQARSVLDELERREDQK